MLRCVFYFGLLFAYSLADNTKDAKLNQTTPTTFWLVNSINGAQTQLTTYNIPELINPNVEKVIIFSHGWLGSKNQDWYILMANAFLEIYPNCIIIEVDWSFGALIPNYAIAAADTVAVGADLGSLITTLDENGISGDKIWLMGHSLGAHVVGFAGKSVQNTNPISRIIALDPAKTYFEGNPCTNRLCSTDAKFVTVIHTDAGMNGFVYPVGDADFYPNNGVNQPGCGFDPIAIHTCSHFRSWTYMIEAVQSPGHFISTKCINYFTYITNPALCGNITVHLGDFNSEEKGVFYLQTNSRSPYSR